MADSKEKHVCNFPGCDRSFPKEWRLVEHVRSHTGERPFACKHEGCDKRFVRAFHLKRHQLTHSQEKNFVCDQCGKSFPTKHNLTRHQQRTHGKPYKCEYEGCTREFTKHSQLKNHMCSHTGEKPYRCDAEGCEASFKTSQKLAKHQKKHVNGYICEYSGCSASFNSWTLLRKHSVTHKSVCDICGKLFSDPLNMKRHQVVHSESREAFPCPIDGCECMYSKASVLRKHISVFHEGARPFTCTMEGCSQTFAHKCSLKKHIAKHYKPKVEKKPRAKKPFASHITGYNPLDENRNKEEEKVVTSSSTTQDNAVEDVSKIAEQDQVLPADLTTGAREPVNDPALHVQQQNTMGTTSHTGITVNG